MNRYPSISVRITTLGALLVGGLLAGGCATHSLYIRDGMNTQCTNCDPAKTGGELRYRVILIGDAGEPVTGTAAAVRKANFNSVRDATIPGKTMIVFLGDNIYPKGLPPNGTQRAAEEDLLTRQLELAAGDTKAVVIPGNHDWDKSGPDGLKRIEAQGDFVNGWLQSDDRIQFLPKRGCPGPVYMEVGEGEARVRLVFFDSEWLVRSGANRDKQKNECRHGPVGDLERYSPHEVNETQFGEAIKAALATDRHLILFGHHPIRTAGAQRRKVPVVAACCLLVPLSSRPISSISLTPGLVLDKK
ncbi:MAG: hypothetical protein E2P02_28545 [Acidobacteria bacterium]|nr:MAG: hypothetical protein E2P02_28545 [Acidobacteriota bacterium]